MYSDAPPERHAAPAHSGDFDWQMNPCEARFFEVLDARLDHDHEIDGGGDEDEDDEKDDEDEEDNNVGSKATKGAAKKGRRDAYRVLKPEGPVRLLLLRSRG